MLDYLLGFIALVYAAEYAFFYVGHVRGSRLRRVVPDPLPRISILVAARNEQATIERALRSLLAQDYPAELTQIVTINDDSDDRTLDIMTRVAADHPDRVTVISTVEETSTARGKALAIAQGMDHATGEIILLTDADCVAPSTWARAIVEYLSAGADVHGGFTVIRAHDIFSAVQQLDWIHLQTLAYSGLAMNVPLGIIGNNLSFRRSSYDAVGGYRAVAFSVTEDFALFKAMRSRGDRVIYSCDIESSMTTLACPTLLDVLRQKQRWSRGGTETGIKGYTVLTIAALMMASIVASPFVSVDAWLAVWGTKFICDLLLMIPTARRLGRVRQLRNFLTFEFYFIAQALVIPILLMNKTVVWKGRRYDS